MTAHFPPEEIECAICDDGVTMEEQWLVPHILREHPRPAEVRAEYPNIHHTLKQLMDEEFESFEEMVSVAEENPEKFESLHAQGHEAFNADADSASTEASSSPGDSSADIDHIDDSRQSSSDKNEELTTPGSSIPEEESEKEAVTVVEGADKDTKQTNEDITNNKSDKNMDQDSTTQSQNGASTNNADTKSNETDTSSENPGHSLESKWFFVGVGGCGGNLVDSVLLRQNTLNDTYRSAMWDQGLEDAMILNTNRAEIGDSYFAAEYAKKDKDEDVSREDISIDYAFGQGGAGTDPLTGKKLFETMVEDQGDNIFRGYYPKLENADISEGVMILHSAVKGTGTGASGPLTRELKERKVDHDNVFHFTVLPNPAELEEQGARFNGLYGVLDAVKHGDAVIVVDNVHLDECNIGVEIEDYENWEDNWRSHNESALAFLEGFTISSVIPDDDNEGFSAGDMFDLMDAKQPAVKWYDDNNDFAPILAPAMGRSKSGISSKKDLKKLINTTLTNGRLVDFKPGTAWGGAFIFYGDDKKVAEARKVAQTDFGEALDELGFEFGFTGMNPGPSSTYFISVDGIDNLRLWTVMWNPKMDSLRDVEKIRQSWKDKYNKLPLSVVQELDEREDEIERLFNTLGYENMLGGGSQ